MALTRTDKGQTVTGALVDRPRRVTGVEHGADRAITGTRYSRGKPTTRRLKCRSRIQLRVSLSPERWSAAASGRPATRLEAAVRLPAPNITLLNSFAIFVERRHQEEAREGQRDVHPR